jgi:hypothetical protein
MRTNFRQAYSGGNPDCFGTSAFSVSKSDVDRVCKYILSQPEHHRQYTFAEEYELFLKHYQDTLKIR